MRLIAGRYDTNAEDIMMMCRERQRKGGKGREGELSQVCRAVKKKRDTEKMLEREGEKNAERERKRERWKVLTTA